MKRFLIGIFVAATIASAVNADSTTPDARSFDGKYILVGRWPDSGKTYSGSAVFSSDGSSLKISRSIGSQKAEAIGEFSAATPDKIPTLTIRFKQDGNEYEETCMYKGDLENYYRITCYVYRDSTKSVGLETYFPDYGQLVR